MIKNQKIYLFFELTKRDVLSRYRGSLLGIAWSLITPLAMLAVFAFVFGSVFQTRWPGNGGKSTIVFALQLYAGLTVFWFVSEIIARAPTLIVTQPNFVKKVLFPLEILPLVSLGSGLFHLGINLLILLGGAFLYFGSLPLSVLTLPILILVLLPMLAGVGWILGALGVYLRDINAIVGVLLQMLMFLSPVFYPITAIPRSVRWAFHLNPLTFPIESLRAMIFEGKYPSMAGLMLYGFFSLVLAYAGYRLFRSLQKGFADVL